MLSQLCIRNVALADKCDIKFARGLNVLSGETGAGKSIIIDSLKLLLGARYDKTLLRFGEEKGMVEGVFDINDHARVLLADNGIDVEDEIVVVTRKFNSDGKTENRINGRIVTIGTLRELTSLLVNIYGQGEYQTLAKKSEHVKIVDFFAGIKANVLLDKLQKLVAEYENITSKLEQIGDISSRTKEIDFITYQIGEIEQADVKKDEENKLLEIRHLIYSQEKIVTALGDAIGKLDGQDINAISLVSNACHVVHSIANLSTDYSEFTERLEKIVDELDDITNMMSDKLEELNFDDEYIDRIENRLQVVRNIKKKYGTYDVMIKELTLMKERLNILTNADDYYLELNTKKSNIISEIYLVSKELHQLRLDKSIEFAKLIERELADLNMSDAKFAVKFADFPEFVDCEQYISGDGMDDIEFYFSANVGQPLKPLIKVISGGELSRFMLALKVVCAGLEGTPVLIFDEIDTGISGITGQEVAKKMAKLALNQQIICITHLPQIASFGDKNFFISKSVLEGQTSSKVEEIFDERLTNEIARLSGSIGISHESVKNAQSMLQWANSYKSTIY